MPWTPGQLQEAAYTSLDFYVRNKPPVDQINIAHPLLSLLERSKMDFDGGKQYIVHQIRTTNADNSQWFGSDGQVGYNSRKTIRQANFLWSNVHSGALLTEEELLQNGISVTDDMKVTPTRSEVVQLTNLLKETNDVINLGHEDFLDHELHLDGTQSTDSVPGLDALISTTPNTGIVGGINRATAGNEYWRNNAQTGISTATAGVLTEAMETQWRNCTRYGGESPNAIICGGKFFDAYRNDAKNTVQREIMLQGNGATAPNMNAGISSVFFKGLPVIWDPMLDRLEAELPGSTVDWDKRCYFLNTKFLRLNPAKGQWNQARRPPRVYDRYTHYLAMTSRFGLSVTKPNSMAVLALS
jgi:hypothetical protein